MTEKQKKIVKALFGASKDFILTAVILFGAAGLALGLLFGIDWLYANGKMYYLVRAAAATVAIWYFYVCFIHRYKEN